MKFKVQAAFSRLRSRFWALSLALTVVATVVPTSAVLGGDAISVQNDAVHMKATLRSTATAAYTLHEMQSSSGALVREYISPAGKVFAVGWQGQQTPDLQQLLGPYFSRFQQAVADAHRNHVGRHPLMIQLPGLSVQLGGHMRALFGKAYLPDMLPQGVRAEDIR